MNNFQQKNIILGLNKEKNVFNKLTSDIDVKPEQNIFGTVNNTLNRLVKNDQYIETKINEFQDLEQGPIPVNLSSDIIGMCDSSTPQYRKYWETTDRSSDQLTVYKSYAKGVWDSVTKISEVDKESKFYNFLGTDIIYNNKSASDLTIETNISSITYNKKENNFTFSRIDDLLNEKEYIINFWENSKDFSSIFGKDTCFMLSKTNDKNNSHWDIKLYYIKETANAQSGEITSSREYVSIYSSPNEILDFVLYFNEKNSTYCLLYLEYNTESSKYDLKYREFVFTNKIVLVIDEDIIQSFDGINTKIYLNKYNKDILIFNKKILYKLNLDFIDKNKLYFHQEKFDFANVKNIISNDKFLVGFIRVEHKIDETKTEFANKLYIFNFVTKTLNNQIELDVFNSYFLVGNKLIVTFNKTVNVYDLDNIGSIEELSNNDASNFNINQNGFKILDLTDNTDIIKLQYSEYKNNMLRVIGCGNGDVPDTYKTYILLKYTNDITDIVGNNIIYNIKDKNNLNNINLLERGFKNVWFFGILNNVDFSSVETIKNYVELKNYNIINTSSGLFSIQNINQSNVKKTYENVFDLIEEFDGKQIIYDYYDDGVSIFNINNKLYVSTDSINFNELLNGSDSITNITFIKKIDNSYCLFDRVSNSVYIYTPTSSTQIVKISNIKNIVKFNKNLVFLPNNSDNHIKIIYNKDITQFVSSDVETGKSIYVDGIPLICKNGNAELLDSFIINEYSSYLLVNEKYYSYETKDVPQIDGTLINEENKNIINGTKLDRGYLSASYINWTDTTKLSNSTIFNIIKDNRNGLYITTDKGIFRYFTDVKDNGVGAEGEYFGAYTENTNFHKPDNPQLSNVGLNDVLEYYPIYPWIGKNSLASINNKLSTLFLSTKYIDTRIDGETSLFASDSSVLYCEPKNDFVDSWILGDPNNTLSNYMSSRSVEEDGDVLTEYFWTGTNQIKISDFSTNPEIENVNIIPTLTTTKDSKIKGIQTFYGSDVYSYTSSLKSIKGSATFVVVGNNIKFDTPKFDNKPYKSDFYDVSGRGETPVKQFVDNYDKVCFNFTYLKNTDGEPYRTFIIYEKADGAKRFTTDDFTYKIGNTPGIISGDIPNTISKLDFSFSDNYNKEQVPSLIFKNSIATCLSENKIGLFNNPTFVSTSNSTLKYIDIENVTNYNLIHDLYSQKHKIIFNTNTKIYKWSKSKKTQISPSNLSATEISAITNGYIENAYSLDDNAVSSSTVWTSWSNNVNEISGSELLGGQLTGTYKEYKLNINIGSNILSNDSKLYIKSDNTGLINKITNYLSTKSFWTSKIIGVKYVDETSNEKTPVYVYKLDYDHNFYDSIKTSDDVKFYHNISDIWVYDTKKTTCTKIITDTTPIEDFYIFNNILHILYKTVNYQRIYKSYKYSDTGFVQMGDDSLTIYAGDANNVIEKPHASALFKGKDENDYSTGNTIFSFDPKWPNNKMTENDGWYYNNPYGRFHNLFDNSIKSLFVKNNNGYIKKQISEIFNNKNNIKGIEKFWNMVFIYTDNSLYYLNTLTKYSSESVQDELIGVLDTSDIENNLVLRELYKNENDTIQSIFIYAKEPNRIFIKYSTHIKIIDLSPIISTVNVDKSKSTTTNVLNYYIPNKNGSPLELEVFNKYGTNLSVIDKFIDIDILNKWDSTQIIPIYESKLWSYKSGTTKLGEILSSYINTHGNADIYISKNIGTNISKYYNTVPNYCIDGSNLCKISYNDSDLTLNVLLNKNNINIKQLPNGIICLSSEITSESDNDISAATDSNLNLLSSINNELNHLLPRYKLSTDAQGVSILDDISNVDLKTRNIYYLSNDYFIDCGLPTDGGYNWNIYNPGDKTYSVISVDADNINLTSNNTVNDIDYLYKDFTNETVYLYNENQIPSTTNKLSTIKSSDLLVSESEELTSNIKYKFVSRNYKDIWITNNAVYYNKKPITLDDNILNTKRIFNSSYGDFWLIDGMLNYNIAYPDDYKKHFIYELEPKLINNILITKINYIDNIGSDIMVASDNDLYKIYGKNYSTFITMNENGSYSKFKYVNEYLRDSYNYYISGYLTIKDNYLRTIPNSEHGVNDFTLGNKLFDIKINDFIHYSPYKYLLMDNNSLYTTDFVNEIEKDRILNWVDFNEIILSNFNKFYDNETNGLNHINKYHNPENSFIKNLNEYQSVNLTESFKDFTDEPTIKSDELFKVENDIVDTVIFSEINNSVIQAFYSNFTTNHEFNSIDNISYIIKNYKSGLKEIYVYLPTTNTYYINNIEGNIGCNEYTFETERPNITVGGSVKTNKVKGNVQDARTDIKLHINNKLINIEEIYSIDVDGNSLPLNIYMDPNDTCSGSEKYFHSYILPSIVYKKDNQIFVKDLEKQVNIIHMSVFGSDAQAIKILVKG